MRVTTHLLGGRRVGQFVDLKALDTNATVAEAIDKGYVVGKQELVVSATSGVIRSMAKSVSKDGNGRKIDEIVSIQPSIRLKAKLADNCETVSKDNVIAKLRARVLKEGQVDTSDWSFSVDGTSGTITIESITTGEVLGEVVIGEAIEINGTGLDLTDAATIAWLATDSESATQSGTVAIASCTRSATRLTLPATTLSGLTGSTWEGGSVVFTITDSSKKAIVTAVLRVAA